MRFLILVLFPDMTDLLSHKETFSGSYLNYKQFTTRSGLLNWLFPNMYVVVVFFFFLMQIQMLCWVLDPTLLQN